MDIVYCLDTLRVKNFAEITLSLTVKQIEAILCFRTVFSLDTLGLKISTKSLYLQR